MTEYSQQICEAVQEALKQNGVSVDEVTWSQPPIKTKWTTMMVKINGMTWGILFDHDKLIISIPPFLTCDVADPDLISRIVSVLLIHEIANPM